MVDPRLQTSPFEWKKYEVAMMVVNGISWKCELSALQTFFIEYLLILKHLSFEPVLLKKVIKLIYVARISELLGQPIFHPALLV